MGMPEIIKNNTNSGVTIHDLRHDHRSPGLHLPPPVAGETPRVFYVKDMFGDKLLRASQGLRHAITKGLVVEVKRSELEALEKTKNPETLTDRIETAVGKVPSRRKKGEKGAKHLKQSAEGRKLQADITEAVQKENVFDTALAEKREELKDDVIG